MKYKIFRYFAYTLEIIVFFIIERTPRLIPEIFGEKPIIMVTILLMIALFEGEKAGLGFGLFIGLLIETNVNYNFGFFVILLGVLGYIVGLISKDVINVNFPTAIMVSSVSLLVFFIFSFFYYSSIESYHDAFYIFWRHYLLKIALSNLTLPLTYYLNRPIAVILNEQ